MLIYPSGEGLAWHPLWLAPGIPHLSRVRVLLFLHARAQPLFLYFLADFSLLLAARWVVPLPGPPKPAAGARASPVGAFCPRGMGLGRPKTKSMCEEISMSIQMIGLDRLVASRSNVLVAKASRVTMNP